MSPNRWMACLVLFGLGLVTAGAPAARAQDAPAAPANGAAAAGPGQSADAAADSAADDRGAASGDDDAPLGAAEERAAGDDLNEFIPSEEIPPDEQVTFPADI